MLDHASAPPGSTSSSDFHSSQSEFVTAATAANSGQRFVMGNMSSSFAPECTELKQKYDACFNTWYSEKFLKGKSIENECTDQWEEYQTCVKAALVKNGTIKESLEDAEEEAPFDRGGAPK